MKCDAQQYVPLPKLHCRPNLRNITVGKGVRGEKKLAHGSRRTTQGGEETGRGGVPIAIGREMGRVEK